MVNYYWLAIFLHTIYTHRQVPLTRAINVVKDVIDHKDEGLANRSIKNQLGIRSANIDETLTQRQLSAQV